MVAPASPRP